MTKKEFLNFGNEAREGLKLTPNDLNFFTTKTKFIIGFHGFSKKVFTTFNKIEDVKIWVKNYKENGFLRKLEDFYKYC